MRNKLVIALLLFAPLGFEAAEAIAQDATESRVVYRREVFQYSRAGRADPFRSLLGSVDLGVRPEDLALRVIVADEDPRQSVAIFTQSGANQRIRVRTGDRIGGMTVVAIHPRRVDVVIDDFGVPRRESFYVKKAEPETGTRS
jgi:hypothetical protein